MSEAMHEVWTITDDKAAEWAVEQIRNAQADTLRWKVHFAEQLRRIQAANDEKVAYMTAQLEAYFDTLPHKSTKTQESYQLPSAKLVRKQPAPAFVVDDARLIAHLKAAAPDLVEVVEKPRWGEYKKRCQVIGGELVDKETGELVDGVTVEERAAVFAVEVKGGAQDG